MNIRFLKHLLKRREKKDALDVDRTDFGSPANEMICNQLPVSPNSVACSGDARKKRGLI